ncbi:MAG: patatin-like phospholipase family protein [Smithella sp.]
MGYTSVKVLWGGVKAWEKAGYPIIQESEGQLRDVENKDKNIEPARRSHQAKKGVNLALQGGGAHGAFTWGVLDRLFEDDRIQIEAISGTSAGAMNAVVIADGLMQDGKKGARRALETFWKAVSDAAQYSPIKRMPINLISGNWNLDNSLGYLLFGLLGQLASPYLLNPLNINPLRDLLARQINFERVRSCDLMKLFVAATNVRTGRVRVFTRPELTLDMVMASACLPQLFQAVEIDGEAYWDGGYMGNPVLYPFAYNCTSRDVILVQTNPMQREEIPRNAQEIINRVNEITFNSALMKELRSIEFVGRLLDKESIDPVHYKKMLIHVINAEEELKPLNASSKQNAEWDFLLHLFHVGRKTAVDWLDKNYDYLGNQSSVDLRSLF